MELEHETFRNAKVANLYKASVLKKVGVLKKGWGWGSSPPRGPLIQGEARLPSFPGCKDF